MRSQTWFAVLYYPLSPLQVSSSPWPPPAQSMLSFTSTLAEVACSTRLYWAWHDLTEVVSSSANCSLVTDLALELVVLAPHPATVSLLVRETGCAGSGRHTVMMAGPRTSLSRLTTAMSLIGLNTSPSFSL